MKRFDIITIGGSTEDISFVVDDYVMLDNAADLLHQRIVGFEYGSKVGIKETRTNFGGGAANVAVACARLGLKVTALTVIGKDEAGLRILANLKKHKIDTQLVHTSEGNSGVSFILKTLSGEHVLFTYRGANDRLALQQNAKRAIAKARRVYLSSLSGSWRSVINEILALKTPLAWNPGRLQLAAGFSVLKPYLGATDVLILNKDEALELVLSRKGELKQSGSIIYLLKKLYSFGPRVVVITEGAKGARAYDGERVYIQKASPKKALDTTGVGDAFGATFIASLDKHGDIQRALKAAAKNSGSVVSKYGAQHGLLSGRELSL